MAQTERWRYDLVYYEVFQLGERTDPEIPPALEYSSVTVRGTCPMLGGVLRLAKCFDAIGDGSAL